MVTEDATNLAGQRIGVVGRGGCGKSTVVVLLARALSRHGYEVCVIDADSTNVSLAEALGVINAPYPLLEYFGGSTFCGGDVTCPVDDPTPLSHADIALESISHEYYGQSPDGVFLMTVGRITDGGPGAGCDGPNAKIARDCTVSLSGRPLVSLIDFKAGLEDTARGVLSRLDWVLTVVDATTPAIEVAAELNRTITEIRAGALPATTHLENQELVRISEELYRRMRARGVLCILNKIKDHRTEIFVSERLKERGITPIGVISDDPAIAGAWLMGTPLDADTSACRMRMIVEALEQACVAAAERDQHHPITASSEAI